MSDPMGDAEQCFLEYGVRPARVDRDSAGNLLIDLGDESLLVEMTDPAGGTHQWQLSRVDRNAALEDRLPILCDHLHVSGDDQLVAILPLDVLARLVARCQDA